MKGIVKFIVFIAGAIGLVYGMVAVRSYDEILIGSTYYPAGGIWLMFLLLLILWTTIWLWVFANKVEKRDKKKIEAYPTLTETVTIISKFHEKDVDGVAGVTSTTNSYALVFEFPNKHREKFPVDAKQFALVREGETGVLSYKKLEGVYMDGNGGIASGLLFVGFQPQ